MLAPVVCEGSKTEGTQVIIWDDKPEGSDNQRWARVGDRAERRPRAKSSELVQDVDDEGRLAQKKSDGKAETQLWKVAAVGKQ